MAYRAPKLMDAQWRKLPTMLETSPVMREEMCVGAVFEMPYQ